MFENFFVVRSDPNYANGNTTVLRDLLSLLLNTIKYNSAYLDPEVVCGLISILGHICVASNHPHDVRMCLQCMDGIICYNYIPKAGLMSFISTLCFVSNMESQCVEAWRITRNLMGTHLGHSALYSLCQIIQTEENHGNVGIIRGAIFYIGKRKKKSFNKFKQRATQRD